MPLPCNEPHRGKPCLPIYSEGSELGDRYTRSGPYEKSTVINNYLALT